MEEDEKERKKEREREQNRQGVFPRVRPILLAVLWVTAVRCN
jgi:hypothetical protein